MINKEKAIEIQNFITKIIKKTKKNNKNDIEKFEELIKIGNVDNIIKFMLDKNINLMNLTGISYSFMKILYSKTKIEISNLEEYKLFQKLFLKKENTKFYLQYLKNEYKSPNRKKGNLFKKIILNYNKEFNNFKIITNISDLDNKIENYIYLPEIDSNIFTILTSIGFEFTNIDITKGRDILIKKSNNYYIGEAKEIHENGGSQNNQLKDLENITKIKLNIDNNNIKLKGFGILYGASIFYNNKYSKSIHNNNLSFFIDEFIFNFNHTLKILKEY